jgi:hypothetical protein
VSRKLVLLRIERTGRPNATRVVPLGERLAGTVVAAVREDVGEPP